MLPLEDPPATGRAPVAAIPAAVLESAVHALQFGNELEIEQDPANPRSRVRLFAILTALFLMLFIAALDQTIVATAIPTISAQLHAASGYTWIGGAYLLANAAFAPIWAKLSDIWGRKPILLAAVALFACGSIICALSVSMKMLIIGRAIQGTAGGGLSNLCVITISDLFSMRYGIANGLWELLLTAPRSRTLYLGLLEFMWALAGGIGPVLGGTFTEFVSWRWCFWINLPISGTTFLLLLTFLDVHNSRTKVAQGLKAIDWFGSLSIVGLTLMLLLGLEFGGFTYPWNSPTVICLIAFGALMSLFFVYSEKRLARHPLMPLSLFRQRSNIASLVVCFAQGFVYIAGEYYLPLYFQSSRGESPIRSGLLIIPLTITEAVMGIVAGIVIHRTGRYVELIGVGTILLTLGTGLYILLDATSTIPKIVGFEIVAGLGAGALFLPPLIAIQAHVSQDDTATATATLSFVRNLATSMSIVIGGVVFNNGMKLCAPSLRTVGLSANLTMELSAGDAAANVFTIASLSDPAQKAAVRSAFAWSLRNMWILYTAMSAVGVAASWFITNQVLSKEHVETKTGIKHGQSPATRAVE